jgi:hypothetical protein
MFHATVSKGRFRRGGTGRHPETDYQDNGIGEVGEQVESIRHDRYRPGHQPEDHFQDEQRDGGKDGDPSGQQPVSNANPFVINILEIVYKPIAEGMVGSFKDSHLHAPLMARDALFL